MVKVGSVQGKVERTAVESLAWATGATLIRRGACPPPSDQSATREGGIANQADGAGSG